MKGSWGKPDYASHKSQDPPRDRAIWALAAVQHAVISLAQLKDVGLSASGAGKRVAAGRLYRVHQGVYSLIAPALLTRKGRFMAAVLACGDGAVLSHRAAAVLHELRLRARGLIDVTAPGSRGKDRNGIRVHSAATLLPRDTTLVDNIPTTTLARTLLDVAEDATHREVERAIDAAEQQRTLDMTTIDDVLRRADGRHGAALLTNILQQHTLGCTITRNDLEEAFLQICRTIGLPPDRVNAWIAFPDGGGAEADFLYRHQRLIIEVDGRDVHTTRRAFETDRRRDQRLATLGYRIVRFTWQQVIHQPDTVATTLRALLRG